MTTPSELFEVYSLLANLQMSDPILSVASTVAWLCPEAMASVSEDEIMDLYDQDNLLMAMLTFMKHHPDVYAVGRAELLERDIRTNADYTHVEEALTRAINAKLHLPLEWLDDMAYGPPAYGHGFDGSSDEWWDAHQELEPILNKIGLHRLNRKEWFTRDDRVVGKTLRALAESLPVRDLIEVEAAGEEFEPSEALHCLLAWLDNSTGNTCADYDEESLHEMFTEWPEWSEETVEEINYINREADLILKAARAGEQLLLTDKSWREALITNYRCAERKLKNGRTLNSNDIRWPIKHGQGSGGHGGADQHPTEDHAEGL